MKKKLFYTLAALIIAPGMSMAQAVPPAEFDRVPGLTPHAEVFGMQAWTDDSTRMLWLHDEASGQLIVGYAFDEEGHIVHPDLAETKLGIDNLIDETFKLNEITIPEQYAVNVEALLDMLEEDIRTHVIRDFILRVRTVADEAEFNAAVEGWINELKTAVKDAHPDFDVESLVTAKQDLPATDVGQNVVPEQTEATPAQEVIEDAAEQQSQHQPADAAQSTQPHGNGQVALPAAAGAEGLAPGTLWEPELVDGVSLRDALGAISGERIGRSQDGNIVTVLLDPTCIECKVSWNEMRQSLRGSDVIYDIHVVPAYSEDSYAIIAGLNPDEPVMRSVGKAISGNEISLGRWSELPAELRDQYYARQDLIAKYKVPALPLFVSDTGYATGVLSPELLRQLLQE